MQLVVDWNIGLEGSKQVYVYIYLISYIYQHRAYM